MKIPLVSFIILTIVWINILDVYGVMLPKFKRSSFKLARQYISDNDDIFIPYQGERSNVFDWNLYKLIANKYQGNILISPVSLKLALVLLYEGSQDQTAYELAGALQLPAGQWATRDKFSLIVRSLQPVSDEYTLNLGTRIYINNSLSIKQSYAAIVKTFYSTDIISSNFTDARSTANNVNNWVKNFTNGNIEEMIDDENTIKDSMMLVMNVLYFKGIWAGNKFTSNRTEFDKFYQSSNKNIDINYMTSIGHYYYVESSELDAKIIRLPYMGRKFSMYIILPRTVDGLDTLIKNINPFILTRHVSLLQKLPVQVKIPMFKFDFTSHLEPILRDLGIRDIFENTATLTGIIKTKRGYNLVVSDIIQKAGIEVNENGTSAYVATEVNIGNKVAEQTFHANHPFIFYIEDETTGTILYMGRVINPLEGSGGIEIPGSLPQHFNDDRIQQLSLVPSVAGYNADRNNYFSIELLQGVNEQTTGNVVISPLSVKSALTILSEGAGGDTRNELLTSLRLPSDVSQIRTLSQQTLQSLLSTSAGTEIDLANRLWLGKGIQLPDDFNNILKTNYGGDTSNVVFSNTESTVLTINDWVRQYTRGHIQSIVESSALSPETKLLLTSALYFKGNWRKAFDKNLTRNRCFNIPNQACHSVPMMESVSQYFYASIPDLKAEVVEIPYDDDKISMLVFLPINEGLQDLSVLSRDLSYTPISTILNSLRDTELILLMPRFSVETKIDLRPTLETLGIRNLFTYNANLTKFSLEDSVKVDNVLHNAKIEVNEDGTVAAAVTGLSVVPLMGSSIEAFRVNRPFLFMLIDRQTSCIIFSGRVIRP
ncbi:heparin cofactor 2-like [Microplitis mediator]|uniref:heparin cofactor 2-like n=1 Tax=Microplitis mediator TaxID=375433 RepID=UPI00255477E7|nr:heparin cofactor 2-like [Microplitis mediator]